MSDQLKDCDVCFGTPGLYPILNRFGRHLYDIKCPECDGDGKVENPEFIERRDLSNGR